MALILDTSRALRSHDELVTLVRAVMAANPEDESRALEWKSGYADLLSIEASFALARAVLGLANRSVEVAQAQFEGLGYVVVGAEPGVVSGQVIPDSAELLNSIRRFTGHSYPSWDPRSVSIDGVQVLVITVDAPSPGDRFALLRKAYQPPKGSLVAEGTIFVRHSGASERATREDIEMLQERLLADAERIAEAARVDEQRQRQRALIADMVQAAHGWVDALQIMTIASGGSKWDSTDMAKWVDTDSGRAMASNMQLIKLNARKLRLETKSPELLAALTNAEAAINNPEAFDPIWRGTSGNSDARRAAYRHLAQIQRAFQELEQVGIAGLADPG